MKKLITLILILVLAAGAAAADSGYWCFSTFGSTEGVEHLFDGDMFSLSLYMSRRDLTAYIIETIWKNGKPSTVTLRADVKSKATDNFLYFVLENGYIIKGHHDQNGVDFWMDYDHGSVRLHYDDEFNPYLDQIGGKYAQEAP